jgi:hypothetical protein
LADIRRTVFGVLSGAEDDAERDAKSKTAFEMHVVRVEVGNLLQPVPIQNLELRPFAAYQALCFQNLQCFVDVDERKAECVGEVALGRVEV